MKFGNIILFERDTTYQENLPLVDRIVHVCCALNNICNTVVSFDQVCYTALVMVTKF